MDFSQFFNTDDPNNAMKLGMLSGLLQATAPSTRPVGFGESIGAALQGGMQGQQAAVNAQYRKLQGQKIQQEISQQQAMQRMLGDVFGGGQQQPQAMGFQQGENAGIPNGQTPTMGGQTPAIGGQMPQPLQRGGIGNVDITKLAAIRAMGGQDLLPFYQEANKPQVYEQGKTYEFKDGSSRFMPQLPEGSQFDPATGRITDVPGYTPMMTQRTASIEGAKQWAGVQPAIATTQGQEWAKVAPQLALEGGKAKITSQNTPMEVVTPTGQKVIVPRDQVLGGLLTNGQPVPFTAQQSPADIQWQEGRAKQNVDDYTKMQTNASQASQQLARIDRVNQLLADVGGGKLDPLGREVASAASSLGLKVDKKLGNKQAAEAIATEMALNMRQPGTGVMTDKDYEAFRSTVPDLAKTPEGRMQITTTMQGFLKRDVAEAELANKYREKYGKIDDNFYTQLNRWRQANPVWSGK
jgi:hypothetical protein